MSNRNKIVILVVLLFAILFIISHSYASISSSSIISNISNGRDFFDIHFENATLAKSIGVNTEDTWANVSLDKLSLSINVSDLSYPGAGAEFSVDILNNGTIPAKVESVKTTGLDNSKAIKVIMLEDFNLNNKVLNPGEKQNLRFIVKLDGDSNEIFNQKTSFGLKINYTQVI